VAPPRLHEDRRDEAPEEYPRQYALSFPTSRNPITHEVRQVVFPISSPSLSLERAAWAVVRTSPLVGSKQARVASPPVVAGRVLGKGRVLVLAGWPILAQSAWEGSALSVNDAETMLRNAFQWVSYPARMAKLETE